MRLPSTALLVLSVFVFTGCSTTEPAPAPNAGIGGGSDSIGDELDGDDPDGNDSSGDIEASFAAPNDDPAFEDLAGLESAEEAAVDGPMVSIVEGTGAPELDGDLALPLATRIGSPAPGRGVTYAYGVRNPRYAAGFHTGQDHAAPIGHAVVAVRAGRIRWSNDGGGAYGRWIGLDADNGRTYVYCHLSSRRYKAGTRVKAGERIGRVGASGNVTGPHLHFEDHPRGPFRYAQVRKPRW